MLFLERELRAHVPDFDWPSLTPATPEQIQIAAADCAPLELPQELVEFWERYGGSEVGIPCLLKGDFGGETYFLPPEHAFLDFRQADDARAQFGGDPGGEPYGTKNLVQIAGVEAMGVFAEILPGSEVCKVWQSHPEESLAWPVLGSIAEMVERIAERVWTTDPEEILHGGGWNLYMGGIGDDDVLKPAISVNLDRQFWRDNPQLDETEAHSFRNVQHIAWPADWLPRNRPSPS